MHKMAAFFTISTILALTYACSDSRDPGAEVVAGLEKAQCNAKLFRLDSETCRTSYDTCRASRDASTCRDAYVACLPAFPSQAASGGRGGGDQGGGDRGKQGDNQDKGSASTGAGSSALATCAATRATCITSTQDPSGCGATATECVKRALHDAYVTKCAEAKVRCDDNDFTDASCATITTRCTEGVAFDKVPEAQCSSPALPAPLPAASDAGATLDASSNDAATAQDASGQDASDAASAADASDASTDAPADG